MQYEKYPEQELNQIIITKLSKLKSIKDISKIDWWWLFFTMLKKHLDNSTIEISDKNRIVLVKIDILIKLLNATSKYILNSENDIYRKIYEIKLDVINKYLEEHTIYAEENKFITNNLDQFNYYPEYSDELFNKKIFEKKEFYENSIPKMNKAMLKQTKKHLIDLILKNLLKILYQIILHIMVYCYGTV